MAILTFYQRLNLTPFREIAAEVGNPLSIVITGFLVFNFAYAPWSSNPINDFLYIRNDGFLLPANHISSALFLAGTTLYFQLMNVQNAAKTLFVIYSTASIHEYILDALNLPAMAAAHTLGYTLTFRWFFWLAFFLIGGLYFATKLQRKRMGWIAIFCALYIGGWIVIATTLNIDTYTILAYAPGPAFNDPIPNFFEVSSWVIPTLFWWLL